MTGWGQRRHPGRRLVGVRRKVRLRLRLRETRIDEEAEPDTTPGLKRVS